MVGSSLSYYYDGDGKRVRKSSGTMYWYGTSSDALDETDASGNLPNEYIFFGGKRIARRDASGNIFYYFADHLGTSRSIVQSGQTTPCYDQDFYPYGHEVLHVSEVPAFVNTCPQNYKFTGKERDSESGLDNFGARYDSSQYGRWMSPDLVNVTENRMEKPSSTLNKYVYAANNPLQYVDPDGSDITYFYDQGGVAGHAILFANNQATGDFAIESFGPEHHVPIDKGVSMYEMGTFTSADDLRSQLTSVTMPTTPELAQQVIDYIRANPDPSLWVFTGPNCSTQVWKILKKVKLGKNGRLGVAPNGTPRHVFNALVNQYNSGQAEANPKNGKDYGHARVDMYWALWAVLPQSQSKAKVEVSTCIKGPDGIINCTSF